MCRLGGLVGVVLGFSCFVSLLAFLFGDCGKTVERGYALAVN